MCSIDGGVRRAGDIIKAVALGAKAVGIGRPFLCAYSSPSAGIDFASIERADLRTDVDAYSSYGSEGVVKAIQILKDEMEMK